MQKKFVFNILVILIAILLILIRQYSCIGLSLSGSIEEEHYLMFDKTNTIIDMSTGKPVNSATVSIPSRGISVKTDENGRFNLNINLESPAILSIEASGYKPFSLTITKDKTTKPLTIGISKKSGKEVIIDATLRHIGDDIFSEKSANAGDFQVNSSGSCYYKEFYIEDLGENNNVILKVGSIIGLDTDIARRLNQGSVKSSISSPTKIYLNSQKIGELKINGDNQEINIPCKFLKPNAYNQLVIETGRNLSSRSRVDYDDIEFINLVLEFR